jgi:hypothetical protein
MVHTRTFEDPIIDIPKGSVRRGCGQVSCGNAPPPPSRPSVSLEQLLLAQNDLMRLLMENETCHGADHQQPQYQDQDSMYSDFLVIQLPVFAEATNPLEADNCLYTMECKFECVRRAGYPHVARDGAA